MRLSTTNKIILFLIIFSAHSFRGQSYNTIQELDSITEKLRIEGNIWASINFNKKAEIKFQKENNNNGIIAAYINIGGLLWSIHQYRESLLYLEKAEDRLRKIKDFKLCAKLYGEYARNYASLGLVEQSNNSLNTAIYFAKQISAEKEKERLLFFYYTWKINNFKELKMTDSVNLTQQKRMMLSPQPLVFVDIAEKYLQSKELDSAEKYLQKALILSPNHSDYQKSMILLAFGNLYTERHNYNKALEYYFQSLAISERLNRKNDVKNLFYLISNTYGKLQDNEKKNQYLEKYSILKDSIINSEKKALSIPFEKINRQNKQRAAKQKITYFALSSIIIIAIVLTIVYIKKKNQSEKLIQEALQHTDELKNKLDEKHQKLVKLAIANDPLFLITFQEIYPEFFKNLTSYHKDLTTTEIEFSALLKLNFSTKDIAHYINVSVRTVESRKYRLRKKLNISSDVNLNKWMMEL